jgi:putative salt-induced outer membrane protein YdiY
MGYLTCLFLTKKSKKLKSTKPDLKSLFSFLFIFLTYFSFLSYYPCLAASLQYQATIPFYLSSTTGALENNQIREEDSLGQKIIPGETGMQEKTPTQEKTSESKGKEESQKPKEQETQAKAEQKTESEQQKSKDSAQTEKKKDLLSFLQPWKKTIELSYVVTGGNTVSSSFSLGNTLIRTPNEKDTYTIKTFFLRSHSTTITRKAIGTANNFTIEEDKTDRLTAENYLVLAQYDHKVTGRLLTNLTFVWDRNKFSGVEGRALWTAGAGVILADTPATKIKSQGGLSFTLRKYTAQSLSSFLGFRYSFVWEQKLFDNSSFGTSFIFDDNLARISDWRYEWGNNLTAPLSKFLALKASLRIIRTHRPPEYPVPLYNADGTETGLTVPIPKQKVDTFFTTTLVFNF